MNARFCEDPEQCRIDESVQWVGRYILAASIICTVAMAADAFNSFRLKKLWFPCNYFSLNAASLTLLGVAMKLPMDLTTKMIKTSKLSSMIFMSTAISNFMTSLGSMNDKDMLPNVIALAILVFTIVADVVIRLVLLWKFLDRYLYVISAALMLFCLASLFSLAVAIPKAKRSLELKYQEKHKVALGEEERAEKREAFSIEDERRYMIKYWVMAASSNPQFVMARSVASTIPAVLCLLAAALLVAVYFRPTVFGWSQYRKSTQWILYVQTAGVALGSIAPLFRCFLAVSFKCSSWRKEKRFNIETYWIQTLVDWRDSFSPLHIRQGKYRKCLHNAKWFAVTFCIALQILFVLLSKILLFFSVLFMRPFISCFKKFMNKTPQEQDTKDLNLNNYVLLLEDEAELPTTILNNICREADKLIHTGKMKQPQNLLQLLRMFGNFSGVGKFDSNEVQSLHGSPKEPPNCWTLPLVTLTSIALALPNTTEQEGERLLSSISEGLTLAKLVDKTRDPKSSQLAASIRKATDICWVGVVLYMQWQEIDLRGMSHKFKDSKKVLEELCDKAEGIFKEEVKGAAMEDPLYWSAKAVAANSMYRISRTIFLSYEEEDGETEERLSVMIADILAACLTNLPHVITTMCHRNCIEKREKRVRKAFLLLGKTEQVVELLQQQEWPALEHDKAADIEEWRAWFRENKDDPAASTSRGSTPTCSGEHLAITVAR